MYNYWGNRRPHPLYEMDLVPDPLAFEMPYKSFSQIDEDTMREKYSRMSNESRGTRLRFPHSIKGGWL